MATATASEEEREFFITVTRTAGILIWLFKALAARSWLSNNVGHVLAYSDLNNRRQLKPFQRNELPCSGPRCLCGIFFFFFLICLLAGLLRKLLMNFHKRFVRGGLKTGNRRLDFACGLLSDTVICFYFPKHYEATSGINHCMGIPSITGTGHVL